MQKNGQSAQKKKVLKFSIKKKKMLVHVKTPSVSFVS